MTSTDPSIWFGNIIIVGACCGQRKIEVGEESGDKEEEEKKEEEEEEEKEEVERFALLMLEDLRLRKQHDEKKSLFKSPPWRNRLARSAVNRKVGGSSPPGGEIHFC
ncbi:hypothetical protein HZH68_014576 [Vespula germanica]|uniref:Uncharacterized protein n=1 Tax=Vespula germanica TaxID=30212 RepID=A0A834JB79_VESGE|nr:hypothetical protein HZH68_014576 [Vespula germanica]